MDAKEQRSKAMDLPPEVLCSIFQHLERDFDLPNAVLVCGLWSEQASYVKWSSSVVPFKVLLNICHKSDMNDEDSDDWVDSTMTGNESEESVMVQNADGFVDQRDILTVDSADDSMLIRMLGKACQIRTLTIDRPVSENLRDSTDKFLRQQGLPCLCSNLLQLQIKIAPDSPMVIPLLAPSNLHSVILNQRRDYSGDIDATLETLVMSAPNLASLAINSEKKYNLSLIAGLSNLKKLSLSGYFDPAAWVAIAEVCAQLESGSLKSEIRPENWHALLKAMPHHVAAFNTLDVVGRWPHMGFFSHHLLIKCQMPNLRIARLGFHLSHIVDEDCVRALESLSMGSPLLESILMSYELGYPAGFLYRSFSGFSFLRKLEIVHGDRDFLDQEEDVEVLAKNLPTVEVLHILRLAPDEGRPRGAPLLSLQKLAIHCKQLRELNLELNASYLAFEQSQLQAPAVPFPRLKEFNIKDLYLYRGHTESIARFISDLCPECDSICIIGDSLEVGPYGDPRKKFGAQTEIFDGEEGHI